MANVNFCVAVIQKLRVLPHQYIWLLSFCPLYNNLHFYFSFPQGQQTLCSSHLLHCQGNAAATEWQNNCNLKYVISSVLSFYVPPPSSIFRTCTQSKKGHKTTHLGMASPIQALHLHCSMPFYYALFLAIKYLSCCKSASNLYSAHRPIGNATG